MSERDKATARMGGGLNMTPMIDVVFLLLIFFIVSTEFRTTEGLLPSNLRGAADPANPGPPPLDEVWIVLSHDPNAAGRSFTSTIRSAKLGGDAHDPAQVTAALRERVARFGEQYRLEARVIIQPDDGVAYNDVVLVLDAVIAARMAKITFASEGV